VAAGQRVLAAIMERDAAADVRGDSFQRRRRELAAAGLVLVEPGRLRRRDELHVGDALDEADVVEEDAVRRLALLLRLRRRQLPLLARRVGPVAEVDAVPELLVDELAGVVVDA